MNRNTHEDKNQEKFKTFVFNYFESLLFVLYRVIYISI